MGILRDFWEYLSYKEKVEETATRKAGPLAELNWQLSGPLIFLIFSTPFIIWLYLIVSWRALILPTAFYILVVSLILYDFKNFRSFKNRNKTISKNAIESRAEKLIPVFFGKKIKKYSIKNTPIYMRQEFLMVIIGIFLIVFDLFLLRRRLMPISFDAKLNRIVLIILGFTLLIYGIYGLNKTTSTSK